MTDKVQVFEGKKPGTWFWHRRASNGEITATGGESYETKQGAFTAAARENPFADIEVIEDDEPVA